MVKKVLFAVVVLVALVGMPRVNWADELDGDGGGCATDLLDCYNAAAKIENFWYRWAAGVDCELKFTDCTRRMLIGS